MKKLKKLTLNELRGTSDVLEMSENKRILGGGNPVETAMGYYGTCAVAGAGYNPTVAGWINGIGYGSTNDDIPWCSAFVNGVLKEAGINVPYNQYRGFASSWSDFGTSCGPTVGAIAYKDGHCGIVTAVGSQGFTMVAGNSGSCHCVNTESYAGSGGYSFRCY